jgi:transcription termination factor Rho
MARRGQIARVADEQTTVNERRRFRPRNNNNRGRRGGGTREPANGSSSGGEWTENEPVNEQDLDTTMSFSPDEGGEGTADGAAAGNRGAVNGDDGSGAIRQQGRRNALDMAQLDKESLEQLRERAKDAGIPSYSRLKKDDLIVRLLRAQAERNGFELRGGVIDVVDDNIGFLRAEHYLPGPDDIYVSPSQIKRFGVRTGDMVIGQVRPPKDSEKYYSLLRVEAINGQEPEQAKSRPHFEKLTPIFPTEAYDIAASGKLSMRLLSLVSPIGKGQRGLIVAPPKVGKTTLMKDIANAIADRHKDVHMMVALIAERPEEATDFDRSVDAEVISSTFDEPVQSHVRVAEMVMNRAKRLVECGKDVVILLDSLTRLARAYNLTVPSSGRTLSGGVDPAALYPPKEFFGAARNIEEGGSLTIIATVLVDTGSKMDDFIFEEFKGTGNMEIHLSRRLADRRIFPAFDVTASSTRRDDLLLGEKTVQRAYLMRRMLNQLTQPQPHGAGYDVAQAMEAFLSRFGKFKTNDEFLASLTKDGI